MHEAGAVGGAIERVISGWPADRRGARLELRIRDATRAEADSVSFYTHAILADRGFGDTTFNVETAPTSCELCGVVAVGASPTDPQCNECGAPLPRIEGPAVVCRELQPAVAPCA
jgi:hypothetical protein